MNIGVFDSGIGGASVAAALQEAFPKAKLTTISDAKNVPYGNRSTDEIIDLTFEAIQPLINGQQDYVVIACNTATAAVIAKLRAAYPRQHFIGLEPMVKPAADLTRTGVVTVCATPATLASQRYNDLKQRYGNGVTFYEPDCSTWASLIEQNKFNQSALIKSFDSPIFDQSDIIILACTHYHWIRAEIEQLAGPGRMIIDPRQAIIQHVKQLEKRRRYKISFKAA